MAGNADITNNILATAASALKRDYEHQGMAAEDRMAKMQRQLGKTAADVDMELRLAHHDAVFYHTHTATGD